MLVKKEKKNRLPQLNSTRFNDKFTARAANLEATAKTYSLPGTPSRLSYTTKIGTVRSSGGDKASASSSSSSSSSLSSSSSAAAAASAASAASTAAAASAASTAAAAAEYL